MTRWMTLGEKNNKRNTRMSNNKRATWMVERRQKRSHCIDQLLGSLRS